MILSKKESAPINRFAKVHKEMVNAGGRDLPMGVESMASTVIRGCPAAGADEKQNPKGETSEQDAQASA